MSDIRFTNTGNLTGVAIGDNARVIAGQIIANVRQSAEQSVNADLVEAVKKALDAIAGAKIPESDQVEAAQTVEKIQKEAEKTEADATRPGRLTRWLASLASICKPAADAITAAKAVTIALGS
ncbi:hypothetical protein J8F10_02515 [Gemmata sp. G18]|uniref:Uncharacterized protein n=1 Tax=Gemmata palustris TaxID=2822762 RepID=A0ABS5BLI2_9BACT|nr:hypothetical protein [Gemmata palustris]MBP3954170.1 hypothetical protein [Gemmata palustris]